MNNGTQGIDLDELLEGSFDGDLEDGGLSEEAKEQKEEIIDAYGAVFNSKAGRKVLDDLLSRTLRISSWVPGQGEEYGYFREGQNTIASYILNNVNKAMGEETKDSRTQM